MLVLSIKTHSVLQIGCPSTNQTRVTMGQLNSSLADTDNVEQLILGTIMSALAPIDRDPWQMPSWSQSNSSLKYSPYPAWMLRLQAAPSSPN